MATVKDVTVTFKTDTKGLEKGSKAVNKLNKEVRKLPASVDALEKELKELEIQLRKATDPRSIKRLGQAIKDQKFVIKDVTREVNRLAGSTQKSFSKLNSGILKIGAVIGVSFGVSKLISFTKELTRTAVRMEAFERRARVVFGESIDIVRKFAEENAKSLGLTENQFLGAAAAAGDLLVPLKFTRQRAAEMAVELTQLGGALKQFTGDQRSAGEISSLVARALTGEVESLKPLGVVISLQSKKFKELVKTKIEDEGVTEGQARALAIYQTALDQSGDALASFEADTESLTRQQAELDANLTQITENLALALTPALNVATKAINGFIDSLTNFDPVGKGFSEQLKEATDFLGEQNKGLVTVAGGYVILTKKGKDLLERFKEITEEDKLIAEALKKQREEEARLAKSNETRIRNISFLRKQLKDLNEERGNSATSIRRIAEINREIIPIQAELNVLLGKAKKATKGLTDEEKRRLALLKQLEETGQKNLKAEQGLAVLRAQQEIDTATSIEDRVNKEIELEKMLTLFKIENQNATAAEQELIEAEFRANINEIKKTAKEEEIENEQEAADALQEIRLAQFNAAVGLASALISLTGQSVQAQAAVLLFEKLAAIASIIINGAKANTLLAAQLGILAPPAIVANNVLTGISIASVAATAIPQFAGIKAPTVETPSGFAEGTMDAPGGMAMVGEKGQEFMYVPSHAQILPNDKTNKYGEAINAMMTNKFDDFVVKDYLPSMILRPEVFGRSSGKTSKYDDLRLRGDVKNGNTILTGVYGQLVYLNNNIGNAKFRQRRGI